MAENRPYFDLYRHGFTRVACAVPALRVADPAHNATATLTLLDEAASQGACLALFPELGLAGYTCDDLFQQRALLDGCLAALHAIVLHSRAMPIVAVVGLPVAHEHRLFNCAAVVAGGQVLGFVPKTYLPSYREFYETRQFASGDTATRNALDLPWQAGVPFGAQLLFQWTAQPLLTMHVEICEDLWVPIPPSSAAALAGATVLANLSASNVTIGKADYRRQLVQGQSARCLAAYCYTAAGEGESTTDLAWDGHALIAENGSILAESARFAARAQVIYADIDLERLSQERLRQTTFGQAAQHEAARLANFRPVRVDTPLPAAPRSLSRAVERFPYVPADAALRADRCREVFQIQVQGLAQRLRFTELTKVIIGVSGGLDSTQALLVCAQAMDRLGLPRSNILAYTMPGFATSERTLDQARRLMLAVGSTPHELDIRPSAEQMLRDLDHPYSQGASQFDRTFENVQAGERTSHLFRLANHHDGLVVGTGDLSELALGWCTFGVGDQMAHYNVNASVPKTLIQYVIRWVADTDLLAPADRAVLADVLATEISPELVPGDGNGGPAQATEATIGPYELHDFFLYYTLRYGYRPDRVAYLAHHAWHDANLGRWPDIPVAQRHAYGIGEIKRHLRTFLWRFFQTSQYKRSTLPNGPKVGSGGSLSPRGDWRAPSDGQATAWLTTLEQVPDAD